MPLVKPTDDPPIQTMIIYGATGVGKTRVCATWPRVAWIGAARELGWKTIENMNPADFYEPGRRPVICKVDSMEDLANDLKHVVFPRIQSGDVTSICLEISIYAEDIVRNFNPNATNKWAKFDVLQDHIMRIDEMVKKIRGLRAVYNALAAPSADEKNPSGMVIPGKKLPLMLPALCEVVGYLRGDDLGQGRVDRVLHLTPYGTFPARHRSGDKMPGVIRNPTFRSIERILRGEVLVDPNGNITEKQNNIVALPPLKTA